MTAYFHPLRRCKRHGLTFGRRTGSVLTSMVSYRTNEPRVMPVTKNLNLRIKRKGNDFK